MLQLHHLDQLRRPLAALICGHVKQTSVKIERLVRIEKFVEIRLFGQVTDPLVLRDVCRVLAKYKNPARCRKQQPQHQLDRCGLARAVRAQQPKNLPAAHLQIQRLQSVYLLTPPKVSVDFAKITGLNDNVGRIVGRCCAGRRRVQCSCHGCGRR